MIVLDTNVISALMRHEPDPLVSAWLNDLPSESIWTTSITVFEIRLGLEILAAQAAGVIAAERRRAGRPVEIRDVQIAGIVSARKATLATGNTRHFKDCGLNLVDPWSA